MGLKSCGIWIYKNGPCPLQSDFLPTSERFFAHFRAIFCPLQSDLRKLLTGLTVHAATVYKFSLKKREKIRCDSYFTLFRPSFSCFSPYVETRK